MRILILLLSNLILINTCGITTHTEIAHRAASHFDYLLNNVTSVKNLIRKYQSAFQAGNPYPDSFYPSICKKGQLGGVSEDTHWTPFINATVNFIRSKYSQPYNENALRLIVFLLGFTSHQIADITWHALGVDQGFLSAMGYVNFHGSFPDAHSVGDPGGDVVNQYELSTRYISDLGDWFIPYEDLYEIYLQYYGKEAVTKEDIIECSSLLFLGRLGEQLAFNLLYQDYSLKSTFLINKLNDYFLGGIDDMATWTQLTWKKVLFMLEQGADRCYLDHNILYVECPGNNLFESKQRLKSKELKLPSEWILDSSFMELKHESNGVVFTPSLKFKEKLVQKREKFSKSESSNKYYLLNDYSQLGWQIKSSDLNNDGSDDLIISAPTYSYENNYQQGKVFIKLSPSNGFLTNSDFDIESVSDIKIDSPQGSQSTRFGHSIEIIDLNQDGFKDLIISAPSFNLTSIQYSGRVYVYYGSSKYTFSTPSLVINCENAKDIVATRYCNLGWSLSKGDINEDGFDDLIIGSPYASTTTCGTQCGFVSVLLSKPNFPNVISLDDFDWFLQGFMSYEWFGFSHKFSSGVLSVGAPSSRQCFDSSCSFTQNDTQAVGRVYLYKYPLSKPIAILEGETQSELFGYSLDISSGQLNNRTLLAVSSPKHFVSMNSTLGLKLNQAGLVRVFDITDLNNIKLTTLLKSDRSYSDFGAYIAFKDIDGDNFNDLIVSAPLRNNDIIVIDSSVEQGRVYVFKGGSKFPQGDITENCGVVSLTPCPSDYTFKVFNSNEAQSRFGQQVEIFKAKSGNRQVGIGSARSDYENKARLSGKMFLFDL